MKNLRLIIITLILSLTFLSSCKKATNLDDIKKYVLDNVPSQTYKSIDLDKNYKDNPKTNITYKSSNTSIISDEGVITYANVLQNEDITFTITISNEKNKQETFEKVVKVLKATTNDEFKNELRKQIPAVVYDNITLSTTLLGLSSIVYTSSNESVLSSKGVVKAINKEENVSIYYSVDNEIGEKLQGEISVLVKKVTLASDIRDQILLATSLSSVLFKYVFPETVNDLPITYEFLNPEYLDETGILRKELITEDGYILVKYNYVNELGAPVSGTYSIPVTKYVSLDNASSVLFENIPYETDSDIELPKKFKGLDVEWTTSDNYVMNKEGEITLLSRDDKYKVTLTYMVKNFYNEVAKGSITITVYPYKLDSIALAFKEQFPDNIYESIEYVEVDYYDVYYVEWSSSNPSIFSNDAQYTRPSNNEMIEITYRVYGSDTFFEDYSFPVKISKYSDIERLNYSVEYLLYDKFKELSITSDLAFPSYLDEYEVSLSYKTSDESIISSTGKVTRYVFDRYVEVECIVSTTLARQTLTLWMVVEAKDISNMTQVQILKEFIDAIAVKEIKKVSFNIYENISPCFNTLVFYDNIDEKKINAIVPVNEQNRPGIIKQSTEFVLVHDTANTNSEANAYKHAEYCAQGGGGTSYQYCVGNDGAYNIIPDNEVAYHAGDGARLFKLIDTGIKATSKLCHISYNSDRYYTFNGVASTVKIPSEAPTNASICSSGIYYEIGDNGNYFINDTYYNSSFKAISNKGGNRNSIGIETCVNSGSNYFKTVRINADLVGTLLIENNLDVLRVIQHNNTSGKQCPYALREASYWQNFRDMVSLEKFGKEHFNGLTFDWISESSALTNDGYISLNVKDVSEVSYSVVIKEGTNVLFTSKYTTKLVK